MNRDSFGVKKMNEMISLCGLLCSDCPAFVATKNNDDNKRKEVAELWYRQYNVKLKMEDINCSGCLSDSEPLFCHCRVCEVRRCAKNKGIENCAHCEEYACEILEKIFKMDPETKKRLDKIRSGI
jgi:hypothetical protein